MPVKASSRPRAFTVVEILVATVLALLLLLLVHRFLVYALFSFSRNSTRSALYQVAGFALSRLEDDLKSTRGGLISVRDLPADPTPLVLSLVPILETLPDGSRVWATEPIVYFWSKQPGLFVRRRVSLAGLSASTPRPLDPSELLTALTSSPREERVVANHLRSLELSPVQLSPIEVKLTLEWSGSHQSTPEVYQETRKITLRL